MTARAVRGSSTYVALSLVQRAVPFLLLPAFAAVLTPAEYGRIAFLVATVAVLGAVLGFGLEPWVVRTSVHLRGDAVREDRFFNTMGLFAVAAPALGALGAGIGFVAIPALHDLEPDVSLVTMAFLAMALQTTSSVFVGAALRAQERFRAYALLSLLQGVGGPLLAVMLVIGLRLGVGGWFAATLIAATVTFVAGFVLLQRTWSRRFAPELIGAAMAFGLPLLPHAVSHWALNLSDRVLLAAFAGPSDVGVYNLAYQLAAPIGLVLIALRQGLMPVYAVAGHDASAREEIADFTAVQVHITGFLALGVGLLGPGVLWLLFPGAYAGGAGFVPWVALGFMFFGFYLVPVDSLSLMLGRTRWIWVPTLIAAVVNVGLNLLLIPEMGALAAAVDTAVAYAVLFGGIVVVRRLEGGPQIRYPLRRMAVGLVVVGIAWVAGLLVAPSVDALAALLVRGALVVVAAVAVVAYDAPWWRAKHRRSPITLEIAPSDDPEAGSLTEATRA